MENEMKRKHCFFFPDFMVSLKVPVAVLMVLFGMIPMVLCTQVLIGTLRQIQTDSRMIEVQNQCQILSSKMTRTGYLRGDSRDGTMDSEIQAMADVYNGRIVVVNRDFRIVQDTFHIAERRFLVAEEVVRCFQGESSSKYNKDKHYFAQTIPIYDSTPIKGIEGVLVITASTEGILSLMDTVYDKAGDSCFDISGYGSSDNASAAFSGASEKVKSGGGRSFGYRYPHRQLSRDQRYLPGSRKYVVET